MNGGRESGPKVDLKVAEKEYGRAMAALATAANHCRWNRRTKTFDTLSRRLAEAEAATAAVAGTGELPAELKLRAIQRSQFSGSGLADCVQTLINTGLRDEARRLVALVDRIDSDETAVAAAIADCATGAVAEASGKLKALAHDASRSARTRLLALAWLITSGAARSSHVPLLEIIASSIDRQDWPSAEMALEALRYLVAAAMTHDDVAFAWGNTALLGSVQWVEASLLRSPYGQEDDVPRWPAEADACG
jgi:hypothetical protein